MLFDRILYLLYRKFTWNNIVENEWEVCYIQYNYPFSDLHHEISSIPWNLLETPPNWIPIVFYIPERYLSRYQTSSFHLLLDRDIKEPQTFPPFP